MVFHIRNTPDIDIDAIDCDELISFVNRILIAELPHFQGNEYHNIDWWLMNMNCQRTSRLRHSKQFASIIYIIVL
jgi:hypothetical protein